MPRYLTSREDLEEMIRDFNSQDVWPASPEFLPSREEIAAYHKRKEAGEIKFGDDTPYDNYCRRFAIAYYNFLNKREIAAIRLDNYLLHQYLLIPILQDGKIEVIMFDPTAEQMFYGLSKPYFIGTAAEVKGLEATDSNIKYVPYRGMDITQVYFGWAKVADINIKLPEEAITPGVLELLEFAPEQISILTGVVTLEEIKMVQNFYSSHSNQQSYSKLPYPEPKLVGDVIFRQAAVRADNISALAESFTITIERNSVIVVHTHVKSNDLRKLRDFMSTTGILPRMWGTYRNQYIYKFDGKKNPYFLEAVQNSRCNEHSFASKHQKRNPLVPHGTSMSRALSAK